MGKPFLVLASNSPRRRELLALSGWDFDTLPSEVDENQRPGETPGLGVRAAEEKRHVFGGHQVPSDHEIIGCWSFYEVEAESGHYQFLLPPGLLGPVHTMSTIALQGRNCPGARRKTKPGRLPGEALQRSIGQFWQQPEGNGRPGAPLFVAFLAKTPSLAFVRRLDWRPRPPVRTCGHRVNRP